MESYNLGLWRQHQNVFCYPPSVGGQNSPSTTDMSAPAETILMSDAAAADRQSESGSSAHRQHRSSVRWADRQPCTRRAQPAVQHRLVRWALQVRDAPDTATGEFLLGIRTSGLRLCNNSYMGDVMNPKYPYSTDPTDTNQDYYYLVTKTHQIEIHKLFALVFCCLSGLLSAARTGRFGQAGRLICPKAANHAARPARGVREVSYG